MIGLLSFCHCSFFATFHQVKNPSNFIRMITGVFYLHIIIFDNYLYRSIIISIQNYIISKNHIVSIIKKIEKKLRLDRYGKVIQYNDDQCSEDGSRVTGRTVSGSK